MPLPAVLGAKPVALGIGLGARLLGGLFGGHSAKKKAEAERKAKIADLELKQNMVEDRRLGNLNAGASILQSLADKGFTGISPEALAALQQRRKYDFSKAVPDANAGAGSGLLSGLFGQVADAASQYAINQGAGGGEGGADVFSPGQPIGGLQGSFQNALGTGGGAFGAGGVGPQGVSLDGLKDLYKLGGSGTQDFG